MGSADVLFSLQVYDEGVLGYLLELVKALPQAKWIQNTQAAAKKGDELPCPVIFVQSYDWYKGQRAHFTKPWRYIILEAQ